MHYRKGKKNIGKNILRLSSVVFITAVIISSTFSYSPRSVANYFNVEIQSDNWAYTATKLPGDWWDLDWLYRKEININHSKVSSDLLSFPVLIDIIDMDLAQKAQTDGDDIVFTDGLGVQLNHEIESYNNSDGHLVVWINVTNLSSSTDTVLYIYYGNPDSNNQENAEGVWDSDFEAVWHLAETVGGTDAWKDSTGNGYNGTDENMAQGDPGTDFNATGKINGAIQLDGTDDGIYTNLYPEDCPRTLGFWINVDSNINDSTVGCHDGASHRFYAGERYNKAFFGVGDSASADVPIDIILGNWYYIVITADGSTARYYLNAVEITNFSYYQSGASAFNFTIGYTNGNNYGFLDGVIDEVRVSYTNRSEGWISTCFNNQNDSDSFYYVGNEEMQVLENHPPNKPINPLPENNSVNIGINPTISVLVTDPDDDTMNVSFYNASDDSPIGTDFNVPNGSRAEIQWSNLQYNTDYDWYAIANDSIIENRSDTWTFTTMLQNNPPYKPGDPLPENNSENIGINPTLSVLVTDPDNDTMNVSFYDASDDSLIGTDFNVPNGSRAEVSWSGLQYNTTYSWYAIANDSIIENLSDVWSFTTEHDSTIPPTISIIKPEEKRFYFRNKRLFRRLLPRAFIIGHVTIEAEAYDNEGIKQVEFYVDGDLKHTSTEPKINGIYIWTLNDRTLFFRHRHTISVTAVDTDDNKDSDSKKVFIINFPLLHPLRP